MSEEGPFYYAQGLGSQKIRTGNGGPGAGSDGEEIKLERGT